MKIADRTPFRSKSGEVDIMGRAQGTLKYGLSWYARLQAQDIVIAVLNKVLGQNFVLLRNIILPNTDIDLPLVLIGPPGIYLINVTKERGVYRARDDEWGTISGERFVPASINQIQRTSKLGRVLQIYLDRAGYKGTIIVDPILMAADPGMHIESVRPAIRIVMSDALERFAISMNQAPVQISVEKIREIAQVIVNGPKEQTPAAPQVEASFQPQDANATLSGESMGFSFDDSAQNQQSTLSSEETPGIAESNLRGHDTQDAESPTYQFEKIPETPQEKIGLEINSSTAGSPVLKKKGLFGMTTRQLLILGGIFLFWLCAIAAFVAFLYFSSF